jgi:hypothetical protein
MHVGGLQHVAGGVAVCCLPLSRGDHVVNSAAAGWRSLAMRIGSMLGMCVYLVVRPACKRQPGFAHKALAACCNVTVCINAIETGASSGTGCAMPGLYYRLVNVIH